MADSKDVLAGLDAGRPQSRLFERCFGGSQARSGGGSTGPGLAIADAVRTAHGGRVTLTNCPGLTRFTVIWPAATSLD